MKYRVGDDLVERLVWITYVFEACFTDALDAFDDLLSLLHSFRNDVIYWTLNCDGLKHQSVSIEAIFDSSVAKNFYCRSLWQGCLWFIREQ